MTRRFMSAVAAIGLLSTLQAHADQVTYDFTGTVGYSEGSSIAVGTSISGTYTFDFANAVSAQSTLPISLTSYWAAQGASVFSSTAVVAGQTVYSSSTDPNTVSTVIGNYHITVGSNPANTYSATESTSFGGGNSSGSEFGLSQVDDPRVVPWSVEGMPVFANASLTPPNGPTGEFYTNINNGTRQELVEYDINSINPAPVPVLGAAWLMLSGLVGIGSLARKKRVA